MNLIRGLMLFSILGWLLGMYACQRAVAETTVGEAQSTGWLPDWVDVTDTYRVLERKEGTTYYVYHCLQDATTGAQWTVRTKRLTEREVREGRAAVNLAAAKVPATAAQKAFCFPEPPPPPGPKALGEPAYWGITCVDACDANGRPDFAVMNLKPAGTTTAGEPCGDPVGMGFYLLPRLQAPTGAVAVTRCAP